MNKEKTTYVFRSQVTQFVDEKIQKWLKQCFREIMTIVYLQSGIELKKKQWVLQWISLIVVMLLKKVDYINKLECIWWFVYDIYCKNLIDILENVRFWYENCEIF